MFPLVSHVSLSSARGVDLLGRHHGRTPGWRCDYLRRKLYPLGGQARAVLYRTVSKKKEEGQCYIVMTVRF